MNGRVTVVCLLFVLASCVGALAQTAPQRNPQAVLLLQKSLSALSGGTTIQDVTLKGTVRRIAGSTNDSGTATLMGTAIGQSAVELSLSSGPRAEIRDVSSDSWTGNWSGPDGERHSIADHNLWTDPTWFFPAFIIRRALSDTGFQISPPDAETLSKLSVEHIAVSEAYNGSHHLPSVIQRLTTVDIYLNQQTLLPSAVAFDIHPDNDARTNIHVRIEFGDYQPEQGVTAPLRIRKYLENGLVFDLRLTSVQINTGLANSNFQTY